MKINRTYLLSFLILFAVEAVIAIFIHDNFIRPYIGDVLIVVLLYFFVKIFINKTSKLLPLYIFTFAVAIEIGQYFHFAELLGLSENRIARIIIGSTFDLKDITCYAIGCFILRMFELFRKQK